MPVSAPISPPDSLISEATGPLHTLHLVPEAGWASFEADLPPVQAAFLKAQDFKGQTGKLVVFADAEGAPHAVAGLGAQAEASLALMRSLQPRLPDGDWTVSAATPLTEAQATGWGLGAYHFDRYKAPNGRPFARLVVPLDILAAAQAVVGAAALARDLVNTPAEDMGPRELEAAAHDLVRHHQARFDSVVGDALLAQNYPAIHAVGRAAAPDREPRLITIQANVERTDWPLVALVGKGVCFDTGGLNMKGGAGMALMKKDMGGAAHVLALTDMILKADLPVRLLTLLPVVENSISGPALRPGDVIASRAGLSIEVGNTDAEGRLILADALTRAAEFEPDVTIDMATLTGAARVAMGPDVVPVFTTDEALAADLLTAAQMEQDPVWRLPLWPGYGEALDSDIADIRNDPQGWAQAGCVMAALFLQRFAPKTGSWMHLDVYAWNPRNRPGFPGGAEAQGLRALFSVLKTRFSSAR